MTKEQVKENVTGLDTAYDRKEAEFDMTRALLAAAEFKTAEDNITTVDIKRAGKLLFPVRIHPIADTDIKLARKKATTKMPNPNGKKYPPIDKDFDSVKFKSWMIYLATIEEDQQRIWGNPTILQKFGLMEPAESIDVLLSAGEKSKLVDVVTDISGFDDEEDENVTEEDFR